MPAKKSPAKKSPAKKSPAKKGNIQMRSINVFTVNFIKLLHSGKSLIGHFFLQCDHRDTDGTTYPTLGIANRAAEDHIRDHPGHVVKVKVTQGPGNS